jgi:adenine phosphoribosyltransferase
VTTDRFVAADARELHAMHRADRMRAEFRRGGKRMDLKKWIRDVPDFPKPGIMFRDISPLLADNKAWRAAVDRLAAIIRPHKPDLLAGIESRGFLVTAPLALEMGCGFMMVRKRGKLPGRTISYTYELEYGTDTIEVQDGFVHPGQRVVVLDDVLATGGTMGAAIELLRLAGADVRGAACIIELAFLEGRKRFDVPFDALVSY